MIELGASVCKFQSLVILNDRKGWFESMGATFAGDGEMNTVTATAKSPERGQETKLKVTDSDEDK